MLLDIKNVINPVNNRRYWAEASTIVVYLKNRLPHSAVKGITPYEALYKSKLKISHLQPFGKDCYIHIPEECRPPGSKLLPCAGKGIFFRYTNSYSIYKIHIPSRKYTMTVNARDVEFHRHLKPQPSIESTIILTISSFIPLNPQHRNLEVHIPTPPSNRDQYINDPDGDISDPD